jgi:hypothetical protein
MSEFNADHDFGPPALPTGASSGTQRGKAEFDFDASVEAAKQEAEAAQLALSMTQILGEQHEIKAALQRFDVVAATREKNEAQRAAALSKLLISPADLAKAAYAGAQSGMAGILNEVVQRVEGTGRSIAAVEERMRRDNQRREGERGLWVQATMYAAIGGAVAILVAGVGGYIVGRNAGAANGYAIARDEVAAVSWANTANGVFARQLDRDGSLQQIRDCSGQQWRIQKVKGRRVCFAGDAPPGQSLQGWYVP